MVNKADIYKVKNERNKFNLLWMVQNKQQILQKLQHRELCFWYVMKMEFKTNHQLQLRKNQFQSLKSTWMLDNWPPIVSQEHPVWETSYNGCDQSSPSGGSLWVVQIASCNSPWIGEIYNKYEFRLHLDVFLVLSCASSLEPKTRREQRALLDVNIYGCDTKRMKPHWWMLCYTVFVTLSEKLEVMHNTRFLWTWVVNLLSTWNL